MTWKCLHAVYPPGYCLGLQLAGGGWRLPDIRELVGLVDRQVLNPSIDVVAFPTTKGAPYWTSTPVKADSLHVWVVSFGGGSLSSRYDGGGALSYVRCVR